MAGSQRRIAPVFEEKPGAHMGFLEHLDELRMRLIRCCLAIAVGMAVAFLFLDSIVDFVLEPTLRTLPPGSELIFTRWSEAFSFYFNVALIAGVVLAAPVVSFQLWRFIAPGLYRSERRFVVPFVIFATCGTVAGALFSHYVLFPMTMTFFASFGSARMRFMPRVEDTFDQYMKMLLAMVIVFQMPTVVFFLARMRMVTARWLVRNIKYAVLAIFVAAAVLTSSPDAWNQIVFAAPMLALYVLSIAIAWIVEPSHEPDAAPRDSAGLRLVFAATVIDQARRQTAKAGERQLRLRRGSGTIAGAVMLMTVAGALTFAQARDLETIPGDWRPFNATEPMPQPGEAPWLTRAHLDAMRVNLAAVAEVFHKTPVLASPAGFVMFPHRDLQFHRAFAAPKATDKKWIVPGQLKLQASGYEADGKTVYDTGSRFTIAIDANDVSGALASAIVWGADAESQLYLEPAPAARERHGFQAFPHAIVITNRTQPLLTPVSQERVLRFQIAESEKRLEPMREYARQIPPGSPALAGFAEMLNAGDAVVKQYRDQLNGMSAADRRAPAYVPRENGPGAPLMKKGDDGAFALLEVNPALFDPARPSDIQWLSIEVECDGGSCHHRHPTGDQALNQLDWKALAALVH